MADGSILPRESGISSRPMKGSVPFQSPDSLRMELNLPMAAELPAWVFAEALTLIVGGGYHGKSTLIKALESGVYNHVAGDGREYVITDSTAKEAAGRGRLKRPECGHLPVYQRSAQQKKDTHCFSTEDASGSTSQAAAVSSKGLRPEAVSF